MERSSPVGGRSWPIHGYFCVFCHLCADSEKSLAKPSFFTHKSWDRRHLKGVYRRCHLVPRKPRDKSNCLSILVSKSACCLHIYPNSPTSTSLETPQSVRCLAWTKVVGSREEEARRPRPAYRSSRRSNASTVKPGRRVSKRRKFIFCRSLFSVNNA